MDLIIYPLMYVESLRQKLEQNPNIVSIMLEPIQGEAGIIIPMMVI